MMNSWIDRDKSSLWHPFTSFEGQPDPVFITHASGVNLYREDGTKIIDAISSWWVNLHGHSHPHIAKAVADQANKLEHVIFAGFTHEPAIVLAERLLRILPFKYSKVFFSDNGSTAVEVALKMAIQYWRNSGVAKDKIIAFEGAYHGDTFGAMSVGERGPFTAHFNHHLFDVEFIPFPSGDEQHLVLQFEEKVRSGDVAAFIFEPLVQAAAGMRMYSAECLDQLLSIAQRYDVITIADEVFTGFGRTGKLFASHYLSHQPNLIALSKGITGGALPLGATICSERILKPFQSSDVYKTFYHGHSFTANPLACAAAHASMDLLLSSQCENGRSLIEECHKRFLPELQKNPNVRNARHLGTILAIELHTGTTSYFNDIRKKIYPFFLQRNILLRPLGNVIYVLPPYVITEGELLEIYEAIRELLGELQKA